MLTMLAITIVGVAGGLALAMHLHYDQPGRRGLADQPDDHPDRIPGGLGVDDARTFRDLARRVRIEG